MTYVVRSGRRLVFGARFDVELCGRCGLLTRFLGLVRSPNVDHCSVGDDVHVMNDLSHSYCEKLQK